MMKQDKELIEAAEGYAKDVVRDSIKDLEAQYGGNFTAGDSCVPVVAKYFQAGAEWQKSRTTNENFWRESDNIVQQTINYDVAIEILAWMRSTANKARCEATSEEEREKFVEEIRVYNAEQRIIDGLSGNEDARRSVYDKVFNYYAPIMRARN